MIPRYRLPEMEAVWSDEARLANWLEIELLAVEALAELGVVPPEDAAACRERAALTVEAVARARGGDPPRRRRLRRRRGRLRSARRADGSTSGSPRPTSSTRGSRCSSAPPPTCCSTELERLLGTTKRLALAASRHGDGRPLARRRGRAHELRAQARRLGVRAGSRPRSAPPRPRDRRASARSAAPSARTHPSIRGWRSSSARGSGLRSVEASTQVIQRDRHAEFMTALAITASTLDKMATEIRHLARTEVREVQEPFAEGQKGSSAMPHKRNPVVSRAGLRPRARDPRLAPRRRSRTWSCGTSATSRTRPPSG